MLPDHRPSQPTWAPLQLSCFHSHVSSSACKVHSAGKSSTVGKCDVEDPDVGESVFRRLTQTGQMWSGPAWVVCTPTAYPMSSQSVPSRIKSQLLWSVILFNRTLFWLLPVSVSPSPTCAIQGNYLSPSLESTLRKRILRQNCFPGSFLRVSQVPSDSKVQWSLRIESTEPVSTLLGAEILGTSFKTFL